jgi:hypothetical protein
MDVTTDVTKYYKDDIEDDTINHAHKAFFDKIRQHEHKEPIIEDKLKNHIDDDEQSFFNKI